MGIGTHIRNARKGKNYTQTQLAETIGVHVITLSRWENEVRVPDGNDLQKLAVALNTSVSYLLGETADPSPPGEHAPPSNAIFGGRLKKMRKQKGLRQVDLAGMLAVSVDTITRWENNLREPRASELGKIADVLETTVGYLLGGNQRTYVALVDSETDGTDLDKKSVPKPDFAPINPAHMIRVRILDKYYRACCGTGIDWGGESVEYEESILLQDPELACRYSDNDIVGIYAEGDSMENIIYDGDLVLFVPHEKNIVYAGVPMVLSYNNSIIMRGVIEDGNKKLTLRAANRDYEDIIVRSSDEFDVCGRIVKIYSARNPRSVL
jgi:transcriptional regulator with XRE-family HTH domain